MLASPSIHRCSTVTGYGHSSFLTKYLSRKKKYVCQACRVGYRRKDSLNNHIKKKHGGDKSSFQETGFLVQEEDRRAGWLVKLSKTGAGSIIF